MDNYDGAKIEVVRWEEYNPRGDSKKPTWFRLENDLATGPAFFDLDSDQKWLWIFILSLVSQKNGAPITWNSGYVFSNTKISASKQFKTIEIFEKFARLRVSRKVTSRDSPATNERTNERTNEIDGKDKICAAPSRGLVFDFEIAYKKYPRKEGKAGGLKICKRDIDSTEDFESLLKAVDRYAQHCVVNKTEPKFIKHFSTFMASWRDWLAPDAGTATMPPDLPKIPVPSVNRAGIDPVITVVQAVSKFSAGTNMSNEEWTLHLSKIQKTIGDDAWALVRKLGGWQKAHQAAASGPRNLEFRLRELL